MNAERGTRNNLSRRTFVEAMSAALIPVPRSAFHVPRSTRLEKVGLELYTVRNLMKDDVDGTLEQLHIKALLGVEALVDRGDVAGELGLVEPLQLQLHGGQGTAAAARGGGRRVVGGPAGREQKSGSEHDTCFLHAGSSSDET